MLMDTQPHKYTTCCKSVQRNWLHLTGHHVQMECTASGIEPTLSRASITLLDFPDPTTAIDPPVMDDNAGGEVPPVQREYAAQSLLGSDSS